MELDVDEKSQALSAELKLALTETQYLESASVKEGTNAPLNIFLLGFFGGGFTDINYEKGKEPWRSGAALKKMVREYYDSLPSFGYPNNVLGNHDVHRVRSRLKSLDLLKVATTILLLAEQQ